MVLTAIFAAFALWRRWLPSWWACLAAILTLNVGRVETRLLVYKPEAFAFILLIWAAWLFDEAIERRSRRWGALAGAPAGFVLPRPSGQLAARGPLLGGILIGRVPRCSGAATGARRLRPDPRASAATDRSCRPFPGARWRIAASSSHSSSSACGPIIGTTGQELSQSTQNGVDQTRVVYNLAYVSDNPFAHPNVPECTHPFGVYSTVRPFLSSNASWFFFDVHRSSSVLLIIGALIPPGRRAPASGTTATGALAGAGEARRHHLVLLRTGRLPAGRSDLRLLLDLGPATGWADAPDALLGAHLPDPDRRGRLGGVAPADPPPPETLRSPRTPRFPGAGAVVRHRHRARPRRHGVRHCGLDLYDDHRKPRPRDPAIRNRRTPRRGAVRRRTARLPLDIGAPARQRTASDQRLHRGGAGDADAPDRPARRPHALRAARTVAIRSH